MLLDVHEHCTTLHYTTLQSLSILRIDNAGLRYIRKMRSVLAGKQKVRVPCSTNICMSWSSQRLPECRCYCNRYCINQSSFMSHAFRYKRTSNTRLVLPPPSPSHNLVWVPAPKLTLSAPFLSGFVDTISLRPSHNTRKRSA